MKSSNFAKKEYINEFHKETIKYIEKTDLNYRKLLGQYFTPKSIRQKLINKLPKDIKNPKILDPACGTGEFLLSIKDYYDKPQLYGWDIDSKLIKIARKIIPEAELYVKDSLLNEEYGQFDIVIGNPPYFEFRPSYKIKQKYSLILNGRTNMFSLFVFQGIKWLKVGGYLAYVVPPSMNNGAYFQKLRNFIVQHTNIEYLHILDNSKLFNDALQSTMLLVLKKGGNKGNYIFKKNGIMIFSENAEYLKLFFNNKLTLSDIGFRVKTGKIVWNQNKHLLTNNPKEGIPLIWAHNIGFGKLIFPVERKINKPQYIKSKEFDIGPAILVNRITGSVKSSILKAALIPPGFKFLAENHVNVIFPPNFNNERSLNFTKKAIEMRNLINIVNQLNKTENYEIIRSITGNTQISKNELERLFPIDPKFL